MSIPRQDSQLSHFLVFFCSQYLCVCLFWQLILAVLYIEWRIDPLFFPKGYELFFLCYILLVNSWSKPGADTRKLGLQSEKRAGGVYLSLTGWPAWVSELFSPNLCKAQNATEPLLFSPLPMAGTGPSLHATCYSSSPSHCHGKTGTLGQGGITWDACVIDHPALSLPSRPPPQSLPRTPELLAQGPVSLLTPEKHPRALWQSLIPFPSR